MTTKNSIVYLKESLRTAESIGDLDYFFQVLEEFFHREEIYIPKINRKIEKRMQNEDAIDFVQTLKSIADISTDQELEEIVVAGVDNGCKEELQRVKSELRTLWLSLVKSC